MSSCRTFRTAPTGPGRVWIIRDAEKRVTNSETPPREPGVVLPDCPHGSPGSPSAPAAPFPFLCRRRLMAGATGCGVLGHTHAGKGLKHTAKTPPRRADGPAGAC